MRFGLFSAAALFVSLLAGSAAHAQDFDAAPQAGSLFDIVDEVRIGGSFHDFYRGFWPTEPERFKFNRFEDITFDVLFDSPQIDAFTWIGSPRPEIGAIINVRGFEHIVHGGLAWKLQVFDTPLYLEGALGAALNNGYADNAPPGWNNLGCAFGFYERASIGADLPGNVTATASYRHTSSGGICMPNEGLGYLSFELGMKF